MTTNRTGPQHRVPTLTEVVTVPDAAVEPTPRAAPLEGRAVDGGVVDQAERTEPAAPDMAVAMRTEEELVARVLADVQRQVDLMVEYRLREALAPLLARATDALIRESRAELASTLRDVVARAVAQEITRHRGR
jgi:hypothetical protein